MSTTFSPERTQCNTLLAVYIPPVAAKKAATNKIKNHTRLTCTCKVKFDGNSIDLMKAEDGKISLLLLRKLTYQRVKHGSICCANYHTNE